MGDGWRHDGATRPLRGTSPMERSNCRMTFPNTFLALGDGDLFHVYMLGGELLVRDEQAAQGGECQDRDANPNGGPHSQDVALREDVVHQVLELGGDLRR